MEEKKNPFPFSDRVYATSPTQKSDVDAKRSGKAAGNTLSLVDTLRSLTP